MNAKRRLINRLLAYWFLFVHDTRGAMRFDLMGLVFMVVAIVIGNLLGPMLGGYVGMGAGLVGSFISGLVIYAIYALITGTKMSVFGAVTFSIAVYVSVIVTGMVAGYFGFVTGIIATVVQAVFLSVVWSYIAPKGQATQVPVSVKGSGRKRRR